MMWEAPFVITFQNKDNLLIYTKTICKSSYKMQKNIISFLFYCHFSSELAKIHIQRSFFIYPLIYLCFVAVNLAKSYI